MKEECEATDFPGWPLILLGFIAVASFTYLVMEAVMMSDHVRHVFEMIEGGVDERLEGLFYKGIRL
jgi:hypothetical protein